MTATGKAWGFARKRDVPADGGKVKVCSRCDLWFSAGPRERVCHGCWKPSERAGRAAGGTGLPPTAVRGSSELTEPPRVYYATTRKLPDITLECAKDWLHGRLLEGKEDAVT